MLRSRLSLAFLALTLVVDACSHEGTTPPVSGIPVSAGPFSASLPGLSGSINFPASNAASGDTVTLLGSTTAPSGLPVLQSLDRRIAQSGSDTSLYFLQLTFSRSTTFGSLPALSFDVSGSIDPTKGPLYLALFDPTTQPVAWQMAAEGPGTVANGIVTFTSAQTSRTFAANQTYVVGLYQVTASPSPSPTPTSSPSPSPSPSPTASPTPSPSPAPVPTPSPTPTPTPPPPGVLAVNPTSVQIYNLGASYAQNISVQEPTYTGAFSESDTCNPGSGQIATIASGNPNGPTATFVATGIASGTCNATFSDTNNQHETISITVTTNGFIIQTVGVSTRKD
jgi:hypothetical protein